MTLAQQMVTDIGIFLDADEHAQDVTIDGETVVAIKEQRVDRIPVNQFGGVQYLQDITRLYVRETDWPNTAPPVSGRRYTIDGRSLQLDTVSLQAGMYVLDFQTGTTA